MKEIIYKFTNDKKAMDFMCDWAAQNDMYYEDNEYDEIKKLLNNAYYNPKDQFIGDFGVFRIYQELEHEEDCFNDDCDCLYLFIIKRDA